MGGTGRRQRRRFAARYHLLRAHQCRFQPPNSKGRAPPSLLQSKNSSAVSKVEACISHCRSRMEVLSDSIMSTKHHLVVMAPGAAQLTTAMPKHGSGAPTSPVSLEGAAPQPRRFLRCKTPWLPPLACASLVLALSCLPFLQRDRARVLAGRLGSGLVWAGSVRAEQRLRLRCRAGAAVR